ncbi:MAG: PAS domain S-box protein, partial [Gammaproteobacteria bacterium]|nr:PAS domain S-box protein [Gammaproteobacteria bacterium]
ETDADAADEPDGELEPGIPVVGVGASAGGLRAFRQLLSSLPAETGMAFVLIQHLDPTHQSLLPELLQPDSPIPVSRVHDGTLLEPNRVYVMEPGQELRLLHNRLHSLTLDPKGRPFHPIDTFFNSLAEDRGSKAIGVILSGTATDGTLGSRSIKEADGITFAQDRDSAEYPPMPGNAVAAGYVDFILPPAEIAHELARLAAHPMLRTQWGVDGDRMLPMRLEALNKILILLRSRTGHDFSYYKRTTIRRRINRRLLLHKLKDADQYIRLLQQDGKEIDELLQDILINVTGFFRDADGFKALQQVAFPALLRRRPAEAPLRIWVPACASGQEVYSIAIVLLESLEESGIRPGFQLFGSDIDEEAIERARQAVYPPSIEDEVSPARLKRWFNKVPGGYRVSTSLRENCVFATQSVVRDPPFSRMDLVSCRNLLIYLEAVLQKKVLQLFHYALQPDGFLLLGGSESIGAQTHLFALKDKAGKLYQKKWAAFSATTEAAFRMEHAPVPPVEDQQHSGQASSAYDLGRVVEQKLVERYAPSGVVIGPDQRILRFLGRAWPYIEHPPGSATLSLYKVVHPDLLLELRAAVHWARKSGADVRKEAVRVRVDGAARLVTIQVLSLGGVIPSEPNLMVLFEPCAPCEPVAAPAQQRDPAANTDASAEEAAGNEEPELVPRLQERIAELERELADTREYMQSIAEEQEGYNEELRSANEEIQSTNEELQSTNEELETAKEELQSGNEELATVNVELENRNEELARTNNDLSNLLNSVNLPVLILGADLSVRQFTRPAAQLLNLIDTDLGRPIGNIKPNIEIPDLERLVLDVIETMSREELELQDRDGHWYLVRVRPYRTLDNRIDGAILLFVEIDDVKRLQRLEQALNAERRFASIARDTEDVVIVQDRHGIIQAWNPAAERLYGYTEQDVLSTDVRVLVPSEQREQVEALLHAIDGGSVQSPFSLERLSKDGRRIPVQLFASRLLDSQGQAVAVATIERPVST